MNQPELGKKISELRKAKGLTQEELVEKCNISVRTLQRIESGDVTPRNYTLKLIFTALDYIQNGSLESNLDKKNSFTINWLEQPFKYFIDLFNLKTNTMKKITILSIMLFSVVMFVVLTQESKAQKVEKQNTEKDSEKTMAFTNFSSKNSHSDNEELFGYNVKFDCGGVHFYSDLIKINLKTREFKAALNGKLLTNRVEIFRTKDEQNDNINCKSNEVVQSNNKIHFKGNAILVYKTDTIIANEIIINYK